MMVLGGGWLVYVGITPADNRSPSERERKMRQEKENRILTYNTEDSLVVTDPATDSALTSLTRGERTGSRILW